LPWPGISAKKEIGIKGRTSHKSTIGLEWHSAREKGKKIPLSCHSTTPIVDYGLVSIMKFFWQRFLARQVISGKPTGREEVMGMFQPWEVVRSGHVMKGFI